MKLSSTLAVGLAALQTAAGAAVGKPSSFFASVGKPNSIIAASEQKRELLQNIVTWDEHSLLINGERLFVFSGEFHPYRLPVPSLWIDVFQKVKALGFNAVSFYTHWALLEGKAGNFKADGVLAFEPFFEAAQQAGIYLIARPGPYINAESSGGGFPGWLQRVQGLLRTSAPDYLAATDNYAHQVGELIAKAQITNGGPVILYQPENEYSGATSNTLFPDPAYMQYVEDQARNASIVVPFISNDAYAGGHNAPGTGLGQVDIYGHDSYPLGFDCANPYTWPSGDLPTYFRADHLLQSPSTPYSLDEFQGGSFDPWGGLGFDQCAELLNQEFERVFYKNNYASGVAILSLYMIYGGTNWGNLGHPGGYTSYDYGSVIAENLTITREKYSELKLQGNFIKVSPAYITATAYYADSTTYTNDTSLTVTPIIGNGTATNFYVIRHTAYESLASTPYKLTIPTSAGNLTVPQLGGYLTLNGRDSKIHLSDYAVGNTTLLYSTAEVFTWKKFSDKTVLILYGGPGETHEIAIKTSSSAKVIEGSSVTSQSKSGTLTINWATSATRRIVQVGDLYVYLLDRNSAYNYWVPDLPTSGAYAAYGSSNFNPESVIIKAGYLIRNVATSGSTLEISADFNATTPIEIIGAPAGTSKLSINGKVYSHTVDSHGVWKSSYTYNTPSIKLPTLKSLKWKYTTGLPEIQSGYDDSAWTNADKQSVNSLVPNITPTSLYGSDYGYNTGYLVFRGHFVATGNETSLTLQTIGGWAYGHSVWLNSTYVGSWTGIDASYNRTLVHTLPNLTAGKSYVFTIVVDNNGLDENWTVGTDEMKLPRGIQYYSLGGTPITWKITGNLGGEDYADTVRGPLNEGGSYPERQGWHQPSPPSQNWASGSPYTGLKQAGIGFYTTTFDLDIPSGWEVPLSFQFTNSTSPPPDYRVQLFVNGWQFGKYTNNIGPQTRFFVPEGILNYNGENTLSLTYWLQQDTAAGLDGLALIAGTPVWTGRPAVSLVNSPSYKKRTGAY